VYYPGWELTIDGKPAPIYAVNGLMRGGAVPAGIHRLVYSYAPRSFIVGRVGSILAFGILALFAIACVKWPVDPVIGVSTSSSSPPCADEGPDSNCPSIGIHATS
jgi:hypothetical protein